MTSKKDTVHERKLLHDAISEVFEQIAESQDALDKIDDTLNNPNATKDEFSDAAQMRRTVSAMINSKAGSLCNVFKTPELRNKYLILYDRQIKARDAHYYFRHLTAAERELCTFNVDDVLTFLGNAAALLMQQVREFTLNPENHMENDEQYEEDKEETNEVNE